MKEIKVRFRTLTPLWTGDAWGKSNKLRLTGIVGSLRWWFEALVRGMGYKACDSTSDSKCQVEIKKPEDAIKIQEKICPVCFLFGTTGWRGRVSLEIEDDNLSKPYNGKIIFKIDGGRGWHYESGLMGEATLKVSVDEFTFEDGAKLIDIVLSIFKILLYLIQEYGMLGARTSMGYGVVRFNIDSFDLSVSEEDWNKFKTFLGFFKEEENRNLPSLKDMFFSKFNVNDSIDNVIDNMKFFISAQNGIIEGAVKKWKDKNWVISSPVVRKEIRKSIKNNFNNNNNLRHFLMGKVNGNHSTFSAIQVSHVYNNSGNLEFRIYGWLPDIFPINGKVNDIRGLLTGLFKNTSPWNSKLPSAIQNSICWNDSGLEKTNSSIKALFSVKDDSQGDS